MEAEAVPKEHARTASKIFNMISLEITQTRSVSLFQVLWLQQKFDPLKRFSGQLRIAKGRTGALNLIIWKKGSFTVFSLIDAEYLSHLSSGQPWQLIVQRRYIG